MTGFQQEVQLVQPAAVVDQRVASETGSRIFSSQMYPLKPLRRPFAKRVAEFVV